MTRRLMTRLCALTAAAMLLCGSALADIAWPEHASPSHAHLQTFVTLTNEALATLGEGQINMAYELLSTFASLGMDGVDIPDGYNPGFVLPVEMYFTMAPEGLHKLELRMHDPERFVKVAAACIHASSTDGISLEQAQQVVAAYAAMAAASPTDSFEEPVVDLQGSQTRTYFAYYPDQFGDNYNWLQMTLIFPRPGSAGASLVIPATPAPVIDDQGYLPSDNYVHFEYFTTPTPEPDSAAMERW